MDRSEYETLQKALKKKLHRTNGYMSSNKEEIYREGILSAMSILSSHQRRINSAQWSFAGYGWVCCSKCATEIPYNTPLPCICPKCGADMENDHLF